MEKTPQVFTLEAVNSLVPRLNELVGRQLDRRTVIEHKLRELSTATGEVPDAIILDPYDPPAVADIKKELVGRIEEYQSGWREVEDMGAVLKDARMGLVAFYGNVDGKLVWLCWKYGEKEVSSYHALDEGYSGRKELRQSIRQRLLN
jgi:hypothetical protein